MSKYLKAKFQRLVDEAWNHGNLDEVDEIIPTDYIEHHSPSPDVEGLDAFKEMIRSIRFAFPDFHLTIHDLILEDDNLAARWSWEGTHTNQTPLFNIPPTGKKVAVIGAIIFHHRDGKLIEGWQYTDDLGTLQQLGVTLNAPTQAISATNDPAV